MDFQSAILHALRTWSTSAHRSNVSVKFEDRGWRHDATSTWDLVMGCKNLDAVLPSTSRFDKTTPMSRLARFYTDCLHDLRDRYPGKLTYFVFRNTKGDVPVYNVPGENGAFISGPDARLEHRVFERCVREEYVKDFREIVARRLGMTI